MTKNNYKLKRKFTFIDLVILLVILGSIFGVSKKFSNAKVSTPLAAKSEKIQVSFFIEEVPEFAASAIEIGSPVRESIQNASFGKVSDITLDKSISWARGEDGNFISSSRDGYSSLLITMDAQGMIGNNGVTIDKSIYYVGQTVTIYAGNSILQNGRISDIKKVE